jgi:hypothetical protein
MCNEYVCLRACRHVYMHVTHVLLVSSLQVSGQREAARGTMSDTEAGAIFLSWVFFGNQMSTGNDTNELKSWSRCDGSGH